MNPNPKPQVEDRSPINEIQKRFAEAGAGITAAKHVVGLEDHREMLRAHRRRVDQGNALMMFPFLKQLGLVPENYSTHFEPPENDDMGAITITGDIHIEQPPLATRPQNGQSVQQPIIQQPSPSPAAPSAAQQAQPNGMPTWQKVVMAGLTAAALGGPIATYLLTRPSKPALENKANPDKDTTLTIEGH